MIQIENLSFSYRKNWTSLTVENASFEMGKVYAILGKNGAGKTTLFKLLTNMLTNYSGRISIFGSDIKQETTVLNKVSIILDDLEVYKDRTGFFNLEYFSRLAGHYDKEEAIFLAEQLGIADVLNKKVKSYSLGMRRKLILMLALLKDTDIYIFDEPFRGLDVETVVWMKKAMIALKEKGKLILISSHVKDDVEDLVDQVMILEKGQVKSIVGMEELQSKARIVKVTDTERFIQFLDRENLSYTQELNKFIIEVNEDAWQPLFQKINSEGFEILEMRKISALDALEGGENNASNGNL